MANMKRRVLSLMMALVLTFSLLPISVLAEELDSSAGSTPAGTEEVISSGETGATSGETGATSGETGATSG